MKFPGKRKSKHYFPVNARDPLLQQFQPENETSAAWVVGIDQTLVDIEAKVDDEFIERYGLSAGHSLVIEDDVAGQLIHAVIVCSLPLYPQDQVASIRFCVYASTKVLHFICELLIK